MTGLALGVVLLPVAPLPATATPVESTSVDVARSDHRQHQTGAERDIALASAWRLDPTLLEPLRTDSAATAGARRRLAALNDRVAGAVAAYDAAFATADDAARDARAARGTLARARGALLAATDRYEADRAFLLDVLNETGAVSSVSAFVQVLSADTHEDLSRGLVVLEQMGRSQSDAVLAAEESREQMRLATVMSAAAAQEARRALGTARRALAAATRARTRVLGGLRDARRLLRDAVLADQLAAALREDAWGVDDVAFPLPADALFTDLDNWGQRGRHWAQAHTGDDFSAPCGTPVLAATGGTVQVRTDQSWSGEWLVMIDTGPGGLSTWYAHLQTLTVTTGSQVEAGRPIGTVGGEGNASGCHLHFEVHPDGGSIYEDGVDPAAWLREVGAYPG